MRLRNVDSIGTTVLILLLAWTRLTRAPAVNERWKLRSWVVGLAGLLVKLVVLWTLWNAPFVAEWVTWAFWWVINIVAAPGIGNA